MALSGSKDPDLSVLRVGASRGEVELQLGPAMNDIIQPNGNHYCTYQYSLGNEPSVGRAIGHGVMDVLTLGLWEVLGTPIEGVAANTEVHTVVIEYGPDMMLKQVLTPYAQAEAIKEDEPQVLASEERKPPPPKDPPN